MTKCRLCNNETILTKHHLIPRCVTNAIKCNNIALKDLCIYICIDCHKKIHESFYTHLVMSHLCSGGINKINILKYLLVEEFLIEKKLLKEWKEYWKEYVNKAYEELDNEHKESKEIM